MQTTVGLPSLGELVPLALLLALFVAAAVWAFRRWGQMPQTVDGLEGDEASSPGFERRGERPGTATAIGPAGVVST